MTPMFTMIGHCRQDNIIYKCTKLHDHSSNKKIDILCAVHAMFLFIPEKFAPPLTFFFYIFFCFYGHIYIT